MIDTTILAARLSRHSEKEQVANELSQILNEMCTEAVRLVRERKATTTEDVDNIMLGLHAYWRAMADSLNCNDDSRAVVEQLFSSAVFNASGLDVTADDTMFPCMG